MDILAHVISPQLNVWSHRITYCWFLHDVTKIQTTKLLMLLRFYFHGVLELLKTNFQTNFSLQKGSWFCNRVLLNFQAFA